MNASSHSHVFLRTIHMRKRRRKPRMRGETSGSAKGNEPRSAEGASGLFSRAISISGRARTAWLMRSNHKRRGTRRGKIEAYEPTYCKLSPNVEDSWDSRSHVMETMDQISVRTGFVLGRAFPPRACAKCAKRKS